MNNEWDETTTPGPSGLSKRSAVVMLVAAALFGAAIAATAGESLSPEDVVEDLKSTASHPGARLTTAEQVGSHSMVDGESVQPLASTENVEVWVGEGEGRRSGDICAVVHYVDDEGTWVQGSSCHAPAMMAKGSLPLAVTTPAGGVDIVLLPDGMDSEPNRRVVSQADGDWVAKNVIIFPLGARPDTLSLTRPDAGTMNLGRPAPDWPR